MASLGASPGQPGFVAGTRRSPCWAVLPACPWSACPGRGGLRDGAGVAFSQRFLSHAPFQDSLNSPFLKTFLVTFLRYSLHTIHFTHLKCTIHWLLL